MSPELFVVRPRWAEVSRIVSERLGKTYTGSYVQQVASGRCGNKSVEALLRELGVMHDQVPTLTSSEEAVAA